MSERATAYKVLPPATPSAAGGELMVRPKVLRRPAHFGARSTIESPTPILIPLQQEQHPAEKPEPAFRAWQDDGKFAITLLAFIIVVNVVVSAWLSAISPVKPVSAQASATTAHAPAANAAVHVLDTSARDISEQ